MATSSPCYKVVILGENGVGKTSIVHRYMFDVFHEGGPPTGRDEERKVVSFKDGRQVELKICDTADQKRADLLTGQFYRDTDAIIFVYDISNSRTLWDSDKWIQDWTLHIENMSSIKILFVGNKKDIAKTVRDDFDMSAENSLHDDEIPARDDVEVEHRDFVDLQQVKVITKRHNFIKTPLECSAKTGYGVKKVFETVAAEVAMVKQSKRWDCICL